MRHCGGNPEDLRSGLLNTVDHYKNIHAKCYHTSQCKTDSNYEPSRIIIMNPAAANLLQGVITKSVLYTHAEDYALAKDTFLVESFNNKMNIFHDKRVAFWGRSSTSAGHNWLYATGMRMWTGSIHLCRIPSTIQRPPGGAKGKKT